MSTITLTNFTDVTASDAAMILEWRNHPETKRWMFSQDNISLENHMNFLGSLRKNDDKLYFLVSNNNNHIGVIDLYDFKNSSCDIGLYKNPSQYGVGKTLLQAIQQKAFASLKLKSIFADVLVENTKAYNLYISFGFKQIDRLVFQNHEIFRMELKNEDR